MNRSGNKTSPPKSSDAVPPEAQPAETGFSPIAQIGKQRFIVLSIAVAAQLATILITWPLWQVREAPPNLPAFSLPDFSFGWLVAISVVLVLAMPKRLIWLHLGVMALAAMFDQTRIQPQFIGISVLMLGCVFPWATGISRWYLVAMWIWTGIHKLLSPDWLSHSSWNLVAHIDMAPDQTYLAFALVIAISEIGLGLLAWFKPKSAAWFCLAVHLGITVFLSPLLRDWNYSVIPWNLTNALVGFWILRNVAEEPVRKWQYAFFALLMTLPAGFYLGLTDRAYSHVLYSDNLPRGVITKLDGKPNEILGWGYLAVPFPNERRFLKQYFELTAQPGEKLHIWDPRPALPDQYFVLTSGGAKNVTRRQFFRGSDDQVIGVGVDSKRSVFALSLAGVRMLQTEKDAMVYAVAIGPDEFSPELLKHLTGLPNLQQIQLAETAVCDDDLELLIGMQRLTGIGLDDTKITDTGIQHLRQIPTLRMIECKNTKVTDHALRQFRDSR